jgi:hypothetical protein
MLSRKAWLAVWVLRYGLVMMILGLTAWFIAPRRLSDLQFILIEIPVGAIAVGSLMRGPRSYAKYLTSLSAHRESRRQK